jgi:hypothetical protein
LRMGLQGSPIYPGWLEEKVFSINFNDELAENFQTEG